MYHAESLTHRSSKLARAESYCGVLLTMFISVRCMTRETLKPRMPKSAKTLTAFKMPATAEMKDKLNPSPEPKHSKKENPGKFDVYAEGGTPANTIMREVLKKMPGNRWCGKLDGNGGRDVAIYIPHAFNPDQPTDFIYHFHGSKGEKFKGYGPARNRLEQVLDSSRFITDSNAVVVYPISDGKRGLSQSRDMYWMDKKLTKGEDDIEKLHALVLMILENDFEIKPGKVRIIIKGHSSGGRAVANVAKSLMGSASSFKVDRMDFLDASYANWASKAYKDGIQNNPNLEMNLFIIPDSGGTNLTTSSPPTRRLIESHPKGLEVINIKGIKHGGLNCAYTAWDREKRKVLNCKQVSWNKFRLKEDSFFE